MRHDFNPAILTQVGHRPWPMPERPWVMTQTWHDLLFAHWPVDAGQLRSRIPADFALDLFDGQAWLGVVPFDMTDVAPRWVPALPGISAFPELNVRTYVRVADKPGVYFFSLDAGNTLAVKAARTLFNLPYYSASMQADRRGTVIHYRTRRASEGRGVEFAATYSPAGPSFAPRPDTLEYFLTERYCLYNRDHRGRPYRLDIHHPPWALQPAEAVITRNNMAEAAGIRLPDARALLHFAKRQDMVAWWPMRIAAG